PLPAKLAGLVREAKWLVLVALALYLLLVFSTFHRADPGWSHSATDAAVRNAGGLVGALVADFLLYLFGVSAYWWVVLCLDLVVWGYRGLAVPQPGRGASVRPRRARGGGRRKGARGGPRVHRRDAPSSHARRGGVQPVHRAVVARAVRARRPCLGAGLCARP